MEFRERFVALLGNDRGSITRLSESVGASPGLISAWKTGEKKPSFDYVPKLADYFGVSTDFLLKGSEPQGNHGGTFKRRNLTGIAESVSRKCSTLLSNVAQIETLTYISTVQTVQDVEAAFLEAEEKAEELNRKFEIIKKSMMEDIPVEYRARYNPSVVIVNKKSDDADVIADFENATLNNESDIGN